MLLWVVKFELVTNSVVEFRQVSYNGKSTIDDHDHKQQPTIVIDLIIKHYTNQLIIHHTCILNKLHIIW